MQHPEKSNHKSLLKKRKFIAILAGIAVLLALAFVLLLPAIKAYFLQVPSVPSQPQHRFETLDEAEAEDLESITVGQLQGETYTLAYENDRLFLQREGGRLPVEEALAKEIVNGVTLIAVEDTISDDQEEIRGHLFDMGLEPSEIIVTVRYLSGREDIFEIGHAIPDESGHYFRWSGSEKIYMCETGLYDLFNYPSSLLLPVEQIALEKSLIDRITLHPQEQPSMDILFTTDISGMVNGALQTPYIYPLGEAEAEALLAAAANFRLGSAQGEVNEENMEAYGFENPLAAIEIHQQAGAYGMVDAQGVYQTQALEEQTLRLVIGRKEEEHFYTCWYKGNCYFVSRFLVAPLLMATPETLTTRNPASMGDAVVTGIEIQTGTGLLNLKRQWVERVLENNQLDTDEQGNLLYDEVATQNGEPMNPERFDSLVTRLQELRVSGDADKNLPIQEMVPRWQITLETAGGMKRMVAAYPLDAFFDAIAVDGVIKHTLQAESLEAVLGDLRP